MIPNRTAAAFLFTAENLFRWSDKVYFWTFTFRQVPRNDEWAMWQWNQFMKAFQNIFPLTRGVRVCELHKTHGIHFHALVNRRIAYERLKKMAYRFGFGVIWVEGCDSGTANYLAKYLTKEYREEKQFAVGRRHWGTIGGLRAIRCKDIKYSSDYTKTKKNLYGKTQLRFGHAMLLRGYTSAFGRYQDWPEDIKRRYQLETGKKQWGELLYDIK